jgi:uncharacterized protein
MTALDKYNHLLEDLKKMGKAAVAFSGGVDSAFLLHAAKEALGDNVMAITIISPYIPKWEVEEARAWSIKRDVEHVFIETGILEEIRFNPIDRCYLCKKAVFSKIKEYATSHGFAYIMDGTNLDDLSDYRPGLRALDELEVVSPLKDNGITKADIRLLSKDMGLETWNKPAYACLLTRVPYDTELKVEDLERIERAEVFLMNQGFAAVRVRTHGDVARIEVPADQRHRFFDEGLLDQLARGVKDAGFAYVALDLEGYRMGSFRITEERPVKGVNHG